MEQVKNGQNKLAQAMQEAALGSINEDIHDICNAIERITCELPEQVKLQLSDLKGDVASLGSALKAVPEQFDTDFSRKMNRILDVALEIDNHSKQLKIDISHHNQQLSLELDKHSKAFIQTLEDNTATRIINDITGYINKQISGLHTISITSLIIYGISSAFVGGSMTGAAFFFYLKSIT